MAYDEAYFRTRETWRDWRIEARELIQAARIHHASRVLEIGCGGGGLMRMLRERGAEVIGVDTLDAALKLAKRQLDADIRGETRIKEELHAQTSDVPTGLVHVGKGGTLPFREGVFDAIVGQHVIEHLPVARAALHDWRRLLRPNGRLVLATPNAQYPDPTHYADSDHVHIFSTRDLQSVVERAGFIIERCSTLFPYLTSARMLRAAGVVAYNLFRRMPYYSERGRTIILAATKA